MLNFGGVAVWKMGPTDRIDKFGVKKRIWRLCHFAYATLGTRTQMSFTRGYTPLLK